MKMKIILFIIVLFIFPIMIYSASQSTRRALSPKNVLSSKPLPKELAPFKQELTLLKQNFEVSVGLQDLKLNTQVAVNDSISKFSKYISKQIEKAPQNPSLVRQLWLQLYSFARHHKSRSTIWSKNLYEVCQTICGQVGNANAKIRVLQQFIEFDGLQRTTSNFYVNTGFAGARIHLAFLYLAQNNPVAARNVIQNVKFQSRLRELPELAEIKSVLFKHGYIDKGKSQGEVSHVYKRAGADEAPFRDNYHYDPLLKKPEWIDLSELTR